MQLERERNIRGDDGASIQYDAATSTFSHAQIPHIPHIPHMQYPSRRPYPLRAAITPRILDGYRALGSHVSSTNSPQSLHIVWVTLAYDAIDDMSGWRTYTGQTRDQIRDDGWLDAIHPDDRQRVAQLWAHARQECAIVQTTYRVRRHDGAYIAFDVRCVPVSHTDGSIQEWVWSHTRHLAGMPDAATGDTALPGERRATTATSALPAAHSEPSAAATAEITTAPASLTSFIPVFEAMADAVVVYDTAGYAQFLNAAARALFDASPSADAAQAAATLTLGDADGRPFAADRSPIERILRGASLACADAEPATITLPDGTTIRVRIAGAPLRDGAGMHACAAVIFRETHDDSLKSQHDGDGRTALAALLALAEAVIFVSDETTGSQATRGVTEVPRATGQRLAALACEVVGCRRVSIVAVAPEQETLHPIAVVGLDEPDERAWWKRLGHAPRLDATLDASVIERLRADQVQLIDLRQPPYNERPNRNGGSTVLVVPMLVSEQLVGILTLDYGGTAHDYGLEEIALAGAVAKLAGLVIERERLLHDSAEAQASVMALREAKRRMDEFLSIVSHELRTPLTVIKANTQLLTRRIASAMRDEQNAALTASLRITPDLLDRTQRQIDRLDRLVSDLLDISRIEVGQLILHTERLDLCGVMREAVDEQRAAWSGRTITLDLPDAPVWVDADTGRISQVVTNYLTNALKYSHGDQQVAITAAPTDDSVRVAVRDHGPGLTREQCEHLWERFHRVSGIEVQSGSGVGLGLGLYISRAIVERHGGVTDVESTPGQGSTFWFTLPLAPPTSL